MNKTTHLIAPALGLATLACALGLVLSCSNPFEPEPETEYVYLTETVTNTVVETVTNTNTHVVSNVTHNNHDQDYLYIDQSYYDGSGWANFYYHEIKSNRTVEFYWSSGGAWQPVPNYGTNVLVQPPGWAHLWDPSSNHIGNHIRIKVLWDEWEYAYSNY